MQNKTSKDTLLTCSFWAISAIVGLGVGAHTAQHEGPLERSKDKVWGSVLQPALIAVAGRISLGYFCLFFLFFFLWSELAEGRRGLEHRPLEWSGEGDPSRKREGFLEETFKEVKALTSLQPLWDAGCRGQSSKKNCCCRG